MKRIFNLLLIATIAIAYTSCSNEVDDVFDKPSAVRIQEAMDSYHEVLRSAPNGWRMEYYGGLQYGGYTMFLKFNNDNTVTVANEVYGPEAAATTHYKLEQSAGVVLSFDEYNALFHFFSDPDNPASVGTKGKGMEGDLEFRVQKVTNDSVLMVGKKHGSRIVMTPAKEEWGEYIKQVSASEADMAFGTYFYIVGNDTATVSASYRQLTFSYVDKEGLTQQVDAPYIVRPNAIHFYDPVTVFGANVTDLVYQGGNDFLFTSNDPNAIMKGYVVPLSEALVSGNWYISYSYLSPAIQSYWDYAAPILQEVEGEKLGYAYYSGKLLYVRSGNYWCGFNMGAEVLSNTQITYAYKDYGGSSAQQGNAKYYWNKKGPDGNYFFRYFILPLAGTFNLVADDVRNPTMIQLVDVEDPTFSYVVTKAAVPATQGMK